MALDLIKHFSRKVSFRKKKIERTDEPTGHRIPTSPTAIAWLINLLAGLRTCGGVLAPLPGRLPMHNTVAAWTRPSLTVAGAVSELSLSSHRLPVSFP